MKKILMVAMTLFVALAVSAQDIDYKELRKERAQVKKMTKSELNEKVSKITAKEAKRLRKEGWVVSPGSLPLEKQLERAYNMQYEIDANDPDGFPKWLVASAQSVGENYDGAKTAAQSLAVMNLAQQMETEVAGLTENLVANNQLGAEDAATITESVSASKNIFAQSIGRTVPVMECYRILKNKNREVRVMIAYNSSLAKQQAKKIIKEDLENRGRKLQGDLDKMLGITNESGK